MGQGLSVGRMVTLLPGLLQPYWLRPEFLVNLIIQTLSVAC